MSVAYSDQIDGSFENRALEAYHERARLTRLLTLQQDLLTHVMQADGNGLSLDSMVEMVRRAFAADGFIVALDKPKTDLHSDRDGVAARSELAQLVRSEKVPLILAQRLGCLKSIEGMDGPVRPDELTFEQPFKWFWAEAIQDIQGADGQTSGGRIIFLFEDERIPSAEDRLAMRSVGPHVHMVLHSMMQTQAIASANERFSKLASTIPGVVYQRRVRPDGDIRYTYISETAQELFGVSAHEILTNPSALFASYAPEYGDTFRKRLLEASRNMTTWDVEATIVMPSGELKYTHAIARPEKEPDGSVLWTGVILDATRIKRAEQAAAATEERTRRAIIESLPQGFMLFDANDKLILRNNHFEKVLPHYAEATFEGADYVDVVRTELSLGIDAAKTVDELENRLAERMERHASHRYFAVERQISEKT
ncbi:MAG: PAS domain-containing protein, partial [Hyphomicrobiaceae bacterium]